jgi:hypothetical protein
LIKAKATVESLQSNLKYVLVEIKEIQNPIEISNLLTKYIDSVLEELEDIFHRSVD